MKIDWVFMAVMFAAAIFSALVVYPILDESVGSELACGDSPNSTMIYPECSMSGLHPGTLDYAWSAITLLAIIIIIVVALFAPPQLIG